MPTFEYKVVPAPTKGQKGKGVRGTEARFAFAIEDALNQLGAEGWEYLRSDTLPSEERHGLTTSTVFRTVLVFRRAKAGQDEKPAPPRLAPPEPAQAADNPPADATQEPDNGVEDTTDIVRPASALFAKRIAMKEAKARASKPEGVDGDDEPTP